jgi:endonuclease YncB( thermonuclease family)
MVAKGAAVPLSRVFRVSRMAGLLALPLLAASVAPAPADETLSGPVPAEVLRVIDGDTIVVRARIWLGQTVETDVRVAGIDTPELRGDCDAERDLAERARDLLIGLLGEAPVTLRDIEYGTFAGRVVARVETAEGDINTPLIEAGLAQPYDGRGARPDWCDVAALP